MKCRAFLIKYGEIGVKGKNRFLFENMLMAQIRHALKPVEGVYEVTKEQGRIYVLAVSEDYDYNGAVEALKCVFGIVGFCPLLQVPDEGFDRLAEAVVDYLAQAYPGKDFTFKTRQEELSHGFHGDQRRAWRAYSGCVSEGFRGCACPRGYGLCGDPGADQYLFGEYSRTGGNAGRV